MSLRSILAGAAAGAAGTTALNAVSYLDVAVRARPASSTPEDTVEKLAEKVHVQIPGEGEDRDNRLAGLGPLSGIVTGVGIGTLLGLARGLGWRPSPAVGAVVATVVVLIGANGPMTALGITDPREWNLDAWLSDVVPHVAYGVVTAATLDGLD
ncbi:MAG: hypothetical protein H0V64_12055 [Geodermatophilaceae bacterium]|nr:hypothetical protein [Geodermatophilaceae bacterium]MDQ3465814.1 hypothetical protein [Actinomycetota bacterium]